MRVFLIVLDSVGIGEAPDASQYGDSGANTLAHLAEAVGGLNLPVLQSMGLGNIPALLPNGKPIRGVAPVQEPSACYGAMQEVSKGKDTTTGHWEIAGLELKDGFTVFSKPEDSFPEDLILSFENLTNRKVIGNKPMSGTEIIEELGQQQAKDGSWIVYTSADSVFQIAAHEEVIPLDELYKACDIARELCDKYRIGRVIARPYIGKPGEFKRTENRRDFSFPLPAPTILDALSASDIPVTTVGKLDDVFLNSGISRSLHVESNAPAQEALMEIVEETDDGLIFVNLIDFDMLYGHRRDPRGYAECLEQTDEFLLHLLERFLRDDILIITADHGNDPTFKGTDHTREYVPLLAYSRGMKGIGLGIRAGFYDIAQSLAHIFGIPNMPLGEDFLSEAINSLHSSD